MQTPSQSKVALLALVSAAGGAARAQPVSQVLGSLTPFAAISRGVHIDSGAVAWFRFQIPETTDDAGRFLDIWTSTDRVPVLADTMLGLYDGLGNLIATNDDGGMGTFSALSFGQGLPVRPNPMVQRSLDGTDGQLAAGEYFLAVGAFPMIFGADGWAASAYAGTPAGNVRVMLSTGGRAELSVEWAMATRTNNCGSGETLITAQPFASQIPPSGAITMEVDLSPLGNSPHQVMFDDATHGDLVAGDGVFSFRTIVNHDGPTGMIEFACRAADNLGNAAAGMAAMRVDACPTGQWILETFDAGDVPATAVVPIGAAEIAAISGSLTQSDVDMYRIRICDLAGFTASTVGGTLLDSQLFLFDLDGNGVVMDDDDPDGGVQSTITGALVPGEGEYYLAICEYGFAPVDGDGQRIWNDGPFNIERAPDAVGNPGPVVGWPGAVPRAGGEYTITMTGACFPVFGSPCSACAGDYDQSGGIDGGDVEAFFTDWAQGASCADVNNDGGVDGQDVEFFFRSWESGEC